MAVPITGQLIFAAFLLAAGSFLLSAIVLWRVCLLSTEDIPERSARLAARLVLDNLPGVLDGFGSRGPRTRPFYPAPPSAYDTRAVPAASYGPRSRSLHPRSSGSFPPAESADWMR